MYSLTILCPEDQVEHLSEALEELDALSISVTDADAQSPQEQALFGEPGLEPTQQAWTRSLVCALFAKQEQASHAEKLITTLNGFFTGTQVQSLQEVPEENWVTLTQAQFEPVSITPSFWIVPSWHQAPEQAKTIITLDPGMAFGTGTHPTTRMCLRWIAQHAHQGLIQNQSVLDYGCGSGILAIAAAKFGAQQVDALDIDEAALTATMANAEKNHVALRTGLPNLANGEYDVVLANILANPLQVLAPLLCQHLGTQGHLVLAGILDKQAELLQQCYSTWLDLTVTDCEEGWILMTAKKS